MLVGRGPEIRAIDEALASARLGRSTRLLIRGEPGIGKTALLDHALASDGSMRSLQARGVEFEADIPFAGLYELLRPALDLLDRLPPVHASALRSSLGLGDRVEADRLIIGAAALELISAYAEQAPLVIAIDDAQWLDPASSDAIAFAGRRLIADPVAILVALREDESSPFVMAGWPELRLSGLDRESAARLLADSGADPMPGDSLDRLLRATGGNPLALVELAGAEPQWRSHSNLDMPVATSVERAYLRRAERLSEGGRQAVLLMAASGTSDLRSVRRAANALEIGEPAFEEAEAAASLIRIEGDRVEFVHPLARAALYHSASPAQRRRVHRALADAMAAPDDSDRRAWHLAASAAGYDAEAAAALDQAARRARESTGYIAAAAAFGEAARLTEDSEARSERFFHAAESAWLGGDAAPARAMLAEARKLTAARGALVDIDALDGHIAMRRGDVLAGYQKLTAAATSIESVDRLKAIRILADAALSGFGAGHPSEMLVAASRALDLLREGDPAEAVLFAHVAYGVLAILAGRGADGARRLHESVALFGAVPPKSVDPLLLMCECLSGLFLREAETERALLDRVLNKAREHAPTAALPMVLFLLGRDAAATDRWAVARADYEEAVRVARETMQFTWHAGAIAGLAWLDALEGRVEECRANAAEARALAEQYGMGFYRAWSMIALGQLELGLGHLEQAIAHFRECEEFLQSIAIADPDLSPAPDIVDALVHLGRGLEAEEISDRFFERAAAKGQPFALARARRCRALLASDDRFDEEFAAALRHHEETPDMFERARTQLYYGERLRRVRRRIDARKQLRVALRSLDQLGATPWAERALAELKASGETARVRDDRYRQQLTPQELQVALTLAAGATTREAAARLYLSPKTIEYHLRHVYDKLEVRNRDELRSALMSPARPQDTAIALPG